MEPINIKDTLKINPKKSLNVEGAVVLELEGYLDTYNSKSFQQYMNGIIEEGFKYIVVDCQNLNYVSSTGIGSFTSFNRILIQKKGELILVRMIPKVYEVFKLLGFLSFFKIFNTFEEVENFLKNKISGTGEVKSSAEETTTTASTSNSIFPITSSCPVCTKELRFSKPGKFRCPNCKNILSVNDDGNITKI